MSNFGISGSGSALSALRNLRAAFEAAGESTKRLGSGLRIDTAADDPAGLAVSERLRSQVRGLQREALNAMDEFSMRQVADAGLGEINAALQNVRELSVQAGNSILTAEDRTAIQAEINANLEHIDSVAANTQFNTKQLLSGELGANAAPAGLGVAGVDVSSPEAAGSAISAVSNAISQVSDFRSALGAQSNNLASVIRYSDITAENTMAAESRIRDLDYAKEVTNMVQANLRAGAAIAVLGQANLQSKMVMSLLTGPR